MIKKEEMEALIEEYNKQIESKTADTNSDDFEENLKLESMKFTDAVNELAKKEQVIREAWDKAVGAQKAADIALLADYNLRQQATIAATPVKPSLEKKPEVASTNLVAPAPKPGEKISDVQKFYDEKYKTEPDGKYKSGYGSEKNAKGDTVLKFPDEKAATEFLEAFAKKEPNPTQLMVKVDEKGEPKGYAFIHGGKAFEGKNAQDIIDKINTEHAPNAEAAQSCLSAFKTSLEATPSRLRTETSCDDKLFKTTVNDPPMGPLSQAGNTPLAPNL